METVSRPVFSLIFPVYNEEKTIGATLDHYLPLKETHGLELIVTDDLSTDGTLREAAARADLLVKNPGNVRSRSMNCNRGAAAAAGDVFIFLDADIRIENPGDFFRSAAAVFAPGTAWAGGMMNHRVYRAEETWSDIVTHALWNAVMKYTCMCGFAISTPGFQMVTRNAFEEVKGFDESIGVAQDIDLCLRLNGIGRTHYFSEFTVRESPRRYRKMGYIPFTVKSSKIWYHMLFKRRSYGEYEAVR